MPTRPPRLTQAEMVEAMRKALPVSQFPGRTTSSWTKAVELDAEVRREAVRDGAKP